MAIGFVGELAKAASFPARIIAEHCCSNPRHDVNRKTPPRYDARTDGYEPASLERSTRSLHHRQTCDPGKRSTRGLVRFRNRRPPAPPRIFTTWKFKTLLGFPMMRAREGLETKTPPELGSGGVRKRTTRNEG
jgi:hypothetical protein